jgi:hypothetical protein
VVYLAILVLVATAGLARLWLQYRREQRNRLADIDGLRSKLERLSAQPALGPAPDSPGDGRTSATSSPRRAVPPTGRSGPLDPVPEPLEQSRREAAKRRIEARRAARARTAG